MKKSIIHEFSGNPTEKNGTDYYEKACFDKNAFSGPCGGGSDKPVTRRVQMIIVGQLSEAPFCTIECEFESCLFLRHGRSGGN